MFPDRPPYIHPDSELTISETRDRLQPRSDREHTSDATCPVCLDNVQYGLETNCGHLFCGRSLNSNLYYILYTHTYIYIYIFISGCSRMLVNHPGGWLRLFYSPHFLSIDWRSVQGWLAQILHFTFEGCFVLTSCTCTVKPLKRGIFTSHQVERVCWEAIWLSR